MHRKVPIEIKMSIGIAPSQCWNELVSLRYRLLNWAAHYVSVKRCFPNMLILKLGMIWKSRGRFDVIDECCILIGDPERTMGKTESILGSVR
jgi:hypothetical protein